MARTQLVDPSLTPYALRLYETVKAYNEEIAELDLGFEEFIKYAQIKPIEGIVYSAFMALLYTFFEKTNSNANMLIIVFSVRYEIAAEAIKDHEGRLGSAMRGYRAFRNALREVPLLDTAIHVDEPEEPKPVRARRSTASTLQPVLLLTKRSDQKPPPVSTEVLLAERQNDTEFVNQQRLLHLLFSALESCTIHRYTRKSITTSSKILDIVQAKTIVVVLFKFYYPEASDATLLEEFPGATRSFIDECLSTHCGYTDGTIQNSAEVESYVLLMCDVWKELQRSFGPPVDLSLEPSVLKMVHHPSVLQDEYKVKARIILSAIEKETGLISHQLISFNISKDLSLGRIIFVNVFCMLFSKKPSLDVIHALLGNTPDSSVRTALSLHLEYMNDPHKRQTPMVIKYLQWYEAVCMAVIDFTK